jgi:predicted tellurium resistance membrane protein TerC
MEFINYDLVLSFVTLTLLEIVLGIDNLIFISLVTYKLPKKNRNKARIFGLSLALIIRVLMLMTLSWIMTLTRPLFHILNSGFSFKDLLLIFGGLFLIAKSGHEIFQDVFTKHQVNSNSKTEKPNSSKSMFAAIAQITLIDFVFSFDSVITAVAMTDNIPIIIAAVVISMIIMLACSESISEILTKYPSLKIIALSLIFMVGIILLADGFEIHISKTYLYFALFFTLTVEILNIVAQKRN